MNLRYLVVLGAIVISVSACSSLSVDTGEDTTDERPSPAEAMDRAGLTLPEEATDATITSKDLPDRRHAWAVTFTAPRAQAEAVCDPMGGVGRQSYVPSTHSALLGDLEVGDDSRGCEATSHDGGMWFRFVLIDPGDPATVHVSLQDMTR